MILKIGKRKVLAALLGVLAVGLAVGAWYFWGTDALLAVVLAAIMIGAAFVISVVVQAERRLSSRIGTAERARMNLMQDMDASLAHLADKLASQLERNVNQLDEKLMQDMDASLAHISDKLAIQLDKKLQRPGEQAEATLRAIRASYTRLKLDQERRLNAFSKSITQAVTRVNRTMSRQFKHSPAEIDALLQVHRRSQMGDPLPLMGGWALTPRGLLQAIDLVNRQGVSLVVECGSGTSTLFLARALELKGSGHLIALEHSQEYLEHTENALQQHGLTEFAEVRHAPLKEMEVFGAPYMWYSRSTVADLEEIDLLLVDGPPGDTGTWARYPAYPLLREKLAPGAIIVVDDAQRSDEKAMVEAWLQMGHLSQLTSSSNDLAILRSEFSSKLRRSTDED